MAAAAGKKHFQIPASLAGTYGTYTFNPTTGSWTYTLFLNLPAPTATYTLSLHDALPISFDGTASHDIDVTITGSNDNATISVVGSQDTAALEAGGVEIGRAHD